MARRCLGRRTGVIDTDRQVFRWSGSEVLCDDVSLRCKYLPLLEEVWQGWDIGWADEDSASLADYVGHPREKVIRAGKDDFMIADLKPPQQRDWVSLVASVRQADSSLKIFPSAEVLPTHYSIWDRRLRATPPRGQGWGIWLWLGGRAIFQTKNSLPT